MSPSQGGNKYQSLRQLTDTLQVFTSEGVTQEGTNGTSGVERLLRPRVTPRDKLRYLPRWAGKGQLCPARMCRYGSRALPLPSQPSQCPPGYLPRAGSASAGDQQPGQPPAFLVLTHPAQGLTRAFPFSPSRRNGLYAEYL